MVILFNAQKGFWPPWPIMCVSKNETQVEQRSIAKMRYAFTPISICKWSVYLATCQVSSNPIEFALRDVHLNSNEIKVFNQTINKHFRILFNFKLNHGIIICIFLFLIRKIY